MKRRWRHSIRAEGLALVVAFATLATACGGGATDASGDTEGAPTGAAISTPARATPEVSAEFLFPSGPAVLVPAGYEPPGDIVDSTGAYLPANGKPTLVFVDAIW